MPWHTPVRRVRPTYIWQALNDLGAERIDHGVRCLDDDRLVRHLAGERVPLTVCPFSNVRLRVRRRDGRTTPCRRSWRRDLMASVHSDDPAYFGGYIGDNYAGVAEDLRLDRATLARIAKNGFMGSFLEPAARQRHLDDIDALVGHGDEAV